MSQFILGLIPRYRTYSLAPLGATYEIEVNTVYWTFDKINYVALGGALILYLLTIVSIIIKVVTGD